MPEDIFMDLWRVIQKYKYHLIDNISDEMKCGLCKYILVVPCSIRCGCRFCHSCITKYLNESNTYCPNKSKFCQLKPIDLDRDVVSDHPMAVRLSQVKVKCIHDNCEFDDELSAIEDHISICNKSKNSCPLFSKGCDRNDLLQDEMNQHLIKDIDFHIKLIVKIIDDLPATLKNTAQSKNADQSDNTAQSKNTAQSENAAQSEKKIFSNLREMLHEFQEKNDKSSVIQEIQRELNSLKVESHSIMKDMSALNEYKKLNETFGPSKSPAINDIRQRLKSVTDENEILKNEFQDLKALGVIIKESILDIQMKSGSESQNVMNLRTVSEQTYDEQQKLSGIVEKLQEKIDKLSQDLHEMRENVDSTKKEFQIKIMEIEFESGKSEKSGYFYWRIDNFSKVWNEAIKSNNGKVNSDSFFSQSKGCKMCLRLWKAEEYLCAGFCLIPGPYDNVIEWPYQMEVFISLIDQTNATEFASCSLKFSCYRTNEAWKKPKSEKNTGLGDKLIKFETFVHNTNLIKNDKIYIKCMVNNFKDIGMIRTLNTLEQPNKTIGSIRILDLYKNFSSS